MTFLSMCTVADCRTVRTTVQYCLFNTVRYIVFEDGTLRLLQLATRTVEYSSCLSSSKYLYVQQKVLFSSRLHLQGQCTNQYNQARILRTRKNWAHDRVFLAIQAHLPLALFSASYRIQHVNSDVKILFLIFGNPCITLLNSNHRRCVCKCTFGDLFQFGNNYNTDHIHANVPIGF